MKRLFASIMAVLMLTVFACAAFAEDAAEDPVLAQVGGEAITLSQAQTIYDEIFAYYRDNDTGYDLEDEGFLADIRENAMAQLLEERFIFQTAKANGLDQISEEDEAQLVEDNNLMWESAIADYISYYAGDEEMDEDEMAAMRINAVAYFGAQGYTVEGTLKSSRDNLVFTRLLNQLTGDFSISDDDIAQTYQTAAQEEIDQNGDSVLMYEYMTYYLGQNLHYRPEGYRGVLHILLQPDQEVFSNYTALAAKLEEQNEAAASTGTDEADPEAEETAEPDVTAEPEEPVTAEQVEEARLAVIASVQSTLDEIQSELSNGTPFLDLVDKFGTDPGMTDAAQRENGYPIHPESIAFDPAFIQGAMSIAEIGGVSEPVVGSSGVHVIYYLKDLPGGILPLDEETRDEIYTSILNDVQTERYQKAFLQWLDETEITFTEEGEAWNPIEFLRESLTPAEEAAEPTAEP